MRTLASFGLVHVGRVPVRESARAVTVTMAGSGQDHGNAEPKETVKTLIAFTDGACTNNGKPGARGSYAVVWPEHPHMNVARLMDPSEKQTNNRAELRAVLMAMHQADSVLDPTRLKTLVVYTDSKLTIDSLVSWMPKWKRNGWVKATDGKPVMNTDLLQALDAKMRARRTSFRHVLAHTTKKDYASTHNRTVDRLAVAALAAARTKST